MTSKTASATSEAIKVRSVTGKATVNRRDQIKRMETPREGLGQVAVLYGSENLKRFLNG